MKKWVLEVKRARKKSALNGIRTYNCFFPWSLSTCHGGVASSSFFSFLVLLCHSFYCKGILAIRVQTLKGAWEPGLRLSAHVVHWLPVPSPASSQTNETFESSESKVKRLASHESQMSNSKGISTFTMRHSQFLLESG